MTLTGVVQDNVERMLARSPATGFDAFSVKNELKTEPEVRAALEKMTRTKASETAQQQKMPHGVQAAE